MALVATLPWPTPAHAAFPGANGKIAFSTDRDGNLEIYSMNADGTSPVNRTNHPAADVAPSYSPDGKRIVYATDRDGNFEIYVMNADGTEPTRLTDDPGSDGGPVFSPDGEKILFHSDRDGDFELYLMNADGTDLVQLTDHPATELFPDWSPGGTQIVFMSNRTGNFDLFVLDVSAIVAAAADGLRPQGASRILAQEEEQNITNSPGDDSQPVFSPNSKKIAFASFQSTPSSINTISTDGTNAVQLTPTEDSTNQSPDWQREPKADLQVEKSANLFVEEGQTIFAEVTVTNNGPSPAKAVKLIDLVRGEPPNTVKKVTAKGCDVEQVLSYWKVTCHPGPLGPGESVTFEIGVLTDRVGQVVEEATVTSVTPDPKLGNNHAVEVTFVEEED